MCANSLEKQTTLTFLAKINQIMDFGARISEI